MGNCYLTKLIGVVNNDNLEVLGQIIIRATSTGTVSISFNTNEAQTVLVKTPAGYTLQTVDVPANGNNVNITQDCSSYDYVDYVIPNKYAVTRCVGMTSSPASSDAQYNIVVGSPNYMDYITSYVLGYTFSATPIEMSSVTVFSTATGTVNIDDITCLSKMLALTTFTNTSVSKGIIKGDLKALIENWCKNGRVSGTIKMTLNKTINDLYWGETRLYVLSDIRSLSVTFSSTGCVVTKTAGSMPFTSTATYIKATDEWTYA